MNTTYEEKKAKKELIEKGWEYLNDNFHKFKQCNKIKIALALCLKDMTPENVSDNPQLANEELEIVNPKNKALVKSRISQFVNN